MAEEQLRLVVPTEAHQAAVMEYREAFLRAGDSMDGTAGLAGQASFAPWLEKMRRNTEEATVEPGLVPSTLLLAVRERDGTLVGMVDIRHCLNEHLRHCGGHIGYSVHPAFRRRGYATQMLGLALETCHRLGIVSALVTCNKDNIASARTILHCGGVLEAEAWDEDEAKTVQRYWVSTKPR